ncbi:MAG: hypothetical protein RLZZ28_1641 [Bacteroidota bacterium]|jgi:hypothetical protein
MKKAILLVFLAAAIGCSNSVKEKNAGENRQEPVIAEYKESNAPVNPLKEAYFGETHVHTSASMDAFIGSNRISPEDAYRFAMGEEMLINGSKHKLKTPLDFCAISDHSEFLGETYTLNTPGSPGYDDSIATQMRTTNSYDKALKLFVKYVITPARTGGEKHPAFYQGPESVKSGWRKNFLATEKYYRPGKFTTIHAFEWTATYNAGNLHRNVFFRDTVFPAIPFTTHESNDPEKLWQWMQEQTDKGSKVLAIPHNSNGSKGYMFPDDTTLSGKKITKAYAAARQKMEPLIEIMQIKGNSEVHPSFWSNDEMANFEPANTISNYSGRKLDKKNYVRDGLKRGLKYEEDMGVNPFKYGFSGGTDNHNGAPGDVEEDNYTVGSHGWGDRSAKDRAKNEIDGWAMAFDINPGSLTGVWAPSNTRGEIWDAMKRKETFATSGVRIKLRFFAGSGFKNKYNTYEELVKDGYAKGVPMGADLLLNDAKQTPQFLVWALKDPTGPKLDRIQIIKGWLEKGQVKEKVYTVAASDGRKIKPDGSVDKLDAPIDEKSGRFNTTKGSTELMATWTDPSFNPDQKAFYYIRVLQLPTARWTYWDEIREGVKFPASVPKTIIERAWASPIWYKGNQMN